MNTQLSSADEPTSELRIGRAFPWATGLAILLGLALLGVFGKIRLPWQQITAEQRAESLRQTAEANNQFGQLADRAQAKAAWRSLQAQLKTTASLYETVAKQLSTLHSKLSELETSELGRRLASLPEKVTAFAALKDAARPTVDALNHGAESAKDYLNVAAAALADESVIVGPEQTIAQAARELDENATQALATVQAQSESLDSLMNAVREASPAEFTLADAVRRQQEQRSAAQLAEITRERERIQQEARIKQLENERLTEHAVQKAELERLEAQQRLRAAEAQATADREKKLVAEAEAKIAAERAHAQKLRQFDSALAEIKSLLAPMISSGRMQLGSSGWTAGEQGPLSLSALKKAKALELNEFGMITLGSIFCGPLCRNDRPRGSFPDTMTTNESTIRRAQELLVEFGEILVEKQMLRP